MNRGYEQILFLEIDKDSIEYVQDTEGDFYEINHDKHTFNFLWDWDAINTIRELLWKLEDYDDLYFMDFDLVNALYEDYESEDNLEGFWKLYTFLHLERFNHYIFDEHFE